MKYLAGVQALIAVVSALASAPHARSQAREMQMTGADFLLACSRPDSEWIGFCHGYVQAIFDAAPVFDEARQSGRGVCAPSGLTRAAIVGAVVRHLTSTRELQSRNAATVVYAVLLVEYPCR